MQIRGATSLADVPYWRKTTDRLTFQILPQKRLFLKPKVITGLSVSFLFSGG
jgi:hypothetical protein